MADILRVPNASTHYRNTAKRQFIAGGSSTVLIELPNNYILGSYEYTKANLAPVINGFWGIHNDTHYPKFKDMEYPPLRHQPEIPYYDPMRNAGTMHAGILGYFGGLYQQMPYLGMFKTHEHLFCINHSCGTIGRRPRPLPFIRDNSDPSVIYVVMSGPNRNEFATVAKINTNTRETFWRQLMVEDEPFSYTYQHYADWWRWDTGLHGWGGSSHGYAYINYTPNAIDALDKNLAPDALGISAMDIDYLYQDADNLYFLMGGPRERKGGYEPTSVYIYSVSKDTGDVAESNHVDIHTLGIIPDPTKSRLSYKFLGFIDQTRFLIDIEQTTEDDMTQFGGTAFNGARIYRALVLYDINDDSSKALWVSDPLMMPFGAKSATEGYLGIYHLTSSLVISELGNSVLMPLHYDVAYRMHAEAIVQVHLNATCDHVLGAEILDGYNSWGMHNILYADGRNLNAVEYNENTYEKMIPYTYPTYWGVRAPATELSYGKQPYPTDSSQREGLSYAYTDSYYQDGMTQTWYYPTDEENLEDRYYRDRVALYKSMAKKSYDYLVTEREQPVLRLHAAMLYNKPHKTILPTGEDIIGQGSFVGNYNGTTVVQPWMRSKDPITISYPWGVIVSFEGFTRSGSEAGVNSGNLYNAAGNIFNLTPNNQGAWYLYHTYTYNGSIYYGHLRNGMMNRDYMAYIGTLPNCSFTMRRAAPDPKNCCIYWNNNPLPIKAVSYSINPDPTYPDYMPTAWVVEAEDADTGDWVVIDEQENQSLAMPPKSTVPWVNGMGMEEANKTEYAAPYRMYSVNPGNTDVDTRQYRNYYPLPNFSTQCPNGANAIRITFKASNDPAKDGIHRIAIFGFMVQEESWEWQPVLPTESITALYTDKPRNFGDGDCCIAKPIYNAADGLPVFGNGSYTHERAIMGNHASTAGSGFPLGLQLAGPRTASAMPGYYGEHMHRNYTDMPGNFWGWSQGVVVYCGDGNGWRAGVIPYYGYEFTSPLEVQGFQLTISGTRISANTQGGVVPSAVIIQGSVDGENWEDIVGTSNPDLMPGLENDYVAELRTYDDVNQPYCMWCKTFIYTLDNPVSYKFYRVTWPADATPLGATPAPLLRCWYINSFTFLKKRDPSYAKDVLPMQSVVDNEYVHHWANGNNTGSQTNDQVLLEARVDQEMPTYGLDDDPTYHAGYWNPWITYKDTSNGRVWGGFDCFKNMHIGYSAHGHIPYINAQNWNGFPTNWYDPRYLRGFIICEAGTLDGTNSVSCTASWQGMLQRMSNFNNLTLSPYSASASMIPCTDESLFQKALYSERIKVMAYVFVRSSFMGTNAGRPTHWKLWGSVDGQQWTLLDERTKTDWTTSDVRNEFKVDSPGWYVYYKVEFLDSTDGGIWLLSIDTLISGIKENDPYVYTRYPRNPVYSTGPALMSSGELVKGDISEVVHSRGFNAPAHITYGTDNTAAFIIDQGEPWGAYGVYLKLNPTMEPSEYPTHIQAFGSDDELTWDELLDKNDVSWTLKPNDIRQPLSNYVDFTNPGKYRYVKIVFHKPAITGKIKEHWLHRTYCIGKVMLEDKHQDLLKIFPDQYVAHADSYMAAPLANLWLSDDSVAQVEKDVIRVRKLDPVSQQLRVIREIRPDGGTGTIISTVLDSGKNIWYWYNTGDAYETNSDDRDTIDGPHGYAVLAAQSSYTPKTVHVKFENPAVAYDGDTMTLKVLTWIEDPMAEGEDKRVSGRVRLNISGGNAQFVDSSSETVEVDVAEKQYTEVEFTADGPDRVHVQAYMLS